MSKTGRKGTQRERLHAAMLEIAVQEGYSAASIARVIAHAGVSRPTFYEYFPSREDCFLAVHHDISRRLLEHIREAVTDAPPERAPQAVVRRLIQYAEAEPAQAVLIANEALAAGSRALDARDRTIGEIEQIVEGARTDLPPDTPTPDLPTTALIGAALRLLCQHMRRSERGLATLAQELTEWIETYSRPAAQHRWHTLEPGPSPGRSPHVAEIPAEPPPPLSSGRTLLSPAEISQNQRWRILFATAQTAANQGYRGSTVAEIAQIARVDKRAFYTHFRDKQQAFLAVHELAFQQAMAVAASAYVSTEDWPERVWRAIHATSQFQGTHVSIAHMGFIESHAVGAPAIQRIEDSHAAFTIFLQEGNQRTTTPPPPITPQAIAAAIFEIGYQQTRHGNPHDLTRLAWHATYLALTPYLGPQAADELIDARRA